MRSDLTYRFSIVNFSKPDSLYNYGMKPVLYSQIEAERHFVGWSRVGSNIRYVILKHLHRLDFTVKIILSILWDFLWPEKLTQKKAEQNFHSRIIKSSLKNPVRQTGFLVYFELDFYCLCSLQKSILKLISAG